MNNAPAGHLRAVRGGCVVEQLPLACGHHRIVVETSHSLRVRVDKRLRDPAIGREVCPVVKVAKRLVGGRLADDNAVGAGADAVSVAGSGEAGARGLSKI